MKIKLKTFQIALAMSIAFLGLHGSAMANLSATVINASAPYPNGDDGQIDLHVNGGLAPYLFDWTGPYGFTSSQEDLVDVFPGTYHVIVTDAACGTAELDVVVCSGNITIEDLKPDELACPGKKPGNIFIEEINGGTQPYTLNWDNGETGIGIDVPAGTYCVTVTDVNGCTGTGCVIMENDPDCKNCNDLKIYGMFTDVAPCPGQSDGIISVAVGQWPIPIYNYTWSTGETTTGNSLSGLAEGDYCVTVTDVTGCTGSACMALKTSSSGLGLYGNVEHASGPEVHDGSIVSQVSGGIPPYSYLWVGEDGYTETTQNIFDLAPGKYCLTVKDASGCRKESRCFEVNGECPSPMLVGIKHNGFITCNGGTGTFEATVSGLGVQPYDFQWSNGATTQTIENIPAGQYCVTLTDANGCTEASCATMTEPEPIVINGEVEGAACDGVSGSITLDVSGGNPSYQYEWNDGSVLKDREGLSEGEYCVMVTDKKGCEGVQCFTIDDNNANVPITLVNKVNRSLCTFGPCNGSINIQPQGSGPFTYSWVGPNGFTANTQDINQLCEGYYTVTVQMDGCSGSLTVYICCCQVNDPGEPLGGSCYPVNASPAIKIEGMVTSIQVSGINDGAIDLAVSNGTGSYTYSWTGPNGFTSTQQDISGLAPGEYCVTVNDGCKERSACFEVVDCELENLTLSGQVSHTCPGESAGSISVSAAGGSAPYSYLWNNGSTNPVRQLLPEGTYCVTVTDKNGCMDSGCYTVDDINNVYPVATSSPCGYSYRCNSVEVDFVPAGISWGYTNPFDCRIYEGTCNATGIVVASENHGFEGLQVNVSDCTIVGFCPEGGGTQIAEFGTKFTDIFAAQTGCATCIGCFSQDGCLFQAGFVPTGPIMQGSPSPGPVISVSTNDCESGCAQEFSCFGVPTFATCLAPPASCGQQLQNTPLTQAVLENNAELTIAEAFTLLSKTLPYGTDLVLPKGVNPNWKDNQLGTYMEKYRTESGVIQFEEYESFTLSELNCGRVCDFQLLSDFIDNENINGEAVSFVGIQPNPFENDITVNISAEVRTYVVIEVTDVMGEKILFSEHNLENGKNEVKLYFEENVPSGIYFVTIKDENRTLIHTERIIKQ